MANKNKDSKDRAATKGVTRGTKKLIVQAIADTQQLNSSVLCQYICDDLCMRFQGDSLDYQLNRMKIPTTGAIMDAIDTYIYRHSKNQVVDVTPKRDKADE